MRKIILPYFLSFALACVCTMYTYADESVANDLELQAIAISGLDYDGQTITLTADIDLSGIAKWTPIGTKTTPFKGTFNGNGHTIKGLRMFNATDGVGLFGYVAQEGSIKQVGIAGGQIMAGGKSRVGALAGVCDGTIEECWSMAEIDAAGSIVGGLVGELTSKGSLTNCYNAGMILNGTDTIGGIVGKNSGGKLENVYYTGYAKNGNAIVGADKNGKYINCYYDRKLYYQMAGAADINGINDTKLMFAIFDKNTKWVTAKDLYPILDAFKTNNAALLSVAPMFIDTKETAPVNHANELTLDFELSIKNSVSWQCRNSEDEAWISINNSNGHVSVTRPCSEIDVIVDAAKGTDSRAVYVRPIKLRDFDRSWFHGKVPVKTFCYGEEAYLNEHIEGDTARYGWKYGSYHYRLTRDTVTQTGDTVRMDTIMMDEVGKSAYNTFIAGYKIDTKTPGTYVVKRWVHDEKCVTEWVCSYETEDSKIDGKFVYTIFPEFDPGEIEFVATNKQTDTLILMPGATLKVDVASVKPATGGGGPITYTWTENDNTISGAESADLTAHPITAKGTYTYKRTAVDSALCAPEDNRESKGQRIYVVWDRFDPDTILSSNKKRFCSSDDANTFTIDAGTAKGGSGTYKYQWYYSIDGGASVAITNNGTNEDFTISDAGLSFATNHTYTFTRRAEDDSRFTNIAADSCKTKGEFTFDIMVGLEPGKIENKRDTFIYSGSSIIAKAENVTDASTGGGWLAYQWEVNNTDISGKNAKSLDMYAINAAGTYTFKRAVTDSADCAGGKKYAEGERVYVVFDKFDPGKILGSDMKYCTVENAMEHIINATYPTGGSGTYNYQWYLLEGSKEKAISGATNRTFKLGDYSSLNLEAGESYTFIRRAEDDTRFTDISSDDGLTDGKQTITIMADLYAGSINDGELDKVCVPYDADGSYEITVKISENKAASGEDNLEYMWIRKPDGKVVGTTKNLNYTFPISEIELGTEYTYTSEVSNPGCDWYESKGEATQYYGREMYAEKTVTVCNEDMPYTMEWTSKNGKTERHTFRSADDKWTVTDESFDCPHDTLIRINVVEIPEIKIDKFASLCQESGMITLYYDQTGGQPDVFQISYSPDLAKYMGINDTIGKIEIPGAIVLRNVPSIGTGDIYLLLAIGYSDGSGCFSHAQRVDMYVSLGGYVYSKYDRVLFVDNNPDNGLLAGDKLKFVSYQWYKNGVEQEGQTGQYYHEDGKLLSGTYYVLLTDTEGHQYRSCDVLMPAETKSSAPQRSAVYPVPVGIGEPLTIEGNGSTQILSFSGECISRTQSVDGKIVIAAPRTAGMYYVQVTNEDGEVEMHKLIVK